MASTIILQPGGLPVIDQYGVAWRLNDRGVISANGVLDRTGSYVQQAVYVNNALWRQTIDQLWSAKSTPEAPWLPSPGTPTSPLMQNGQTAQGVLTIEAMITAFRQETSRALDEMVERNDVQHQITLELIKQLVLAQKVNQNAIILLLTDIMTTLTTPVSPVRITGGAPMFSPNPHPPTRSGP